MMSRMKSVPSRSARHLSMTLALALLVVSCQGSEASSPEGSPAEEEEEDVAAFYSENDITLYVGSSTGGGYDQMARLMADHWSQFIPGNPSITVENMEGAQGIVVLNFAEAQAPRDGSALFMVHRNNVLNQLLEREGVRFDLAEAQWVGNPIEDAGLCLAHERAGIESFDQLFDEPLVVGANIPLEQPFINDVLGTQMDVVAGYAGGNEVNLAIEQGEVDGRCPWSISSYLSHGDRDFVDSLNILVALAASPHPLLPDDVPLIVDYAPDDDARTLMELFFADIGRPIKAPADVPAERVEALRDSFVELMADEDFLADAEQRGLEIIPVDGWDLQELVDRLLAADPDVVDQLKDVIDLEALGG